MGHAVLQDGNDYPTVILSDTSLNGTFVNGTLVGKGNEVTVPNGFLADGRSAASPGKVKGIAPW